MEVGTYLSLDVELKWKVRGEYLLYASDLVTVNNNVRLPRDAGTAGHQITERVSEVPIVKVVMDIVHLVDVVIWLVALRRCSLVGDDVVNICIQVIRWQQII